MTCIGVNECAFVHRLSSILLENNLFAGSDQECDMSSAAISSVGKLAIVKISTLLWKHKLCINYPC